MKHFVLSVIVAVMSVGADYNCAVSNEHLKNGKVNKYDIETIDKSVFSLNYNGNVIVDADGTKFLYSFEYEGIKFFLDEDGQVYIGLEDKGKKYTRVVIVDNESEESDVQFYEGVCFKEK